MSKKVHVTFKGEWMKKEDWLDEDVDWNDTMIIMIKALRPKERPFDWLISYVKIPANAGKRYSKDLVQDCLKAQYDVKNIKPKGNKNK